MNNVTIMEKVMQNQYLIQEKINYFDNKKTSIQNIYLNVSNYFEYLNNNLNSNQYTN